MGDDLVGFADDRIWVRGDISLAGKRHMASSGDVEIEEVVFRVFLFLRGELGNFPGVFGFSARQGDSKVGTGQRVEGTAVNGLYGFL